MVFCSLFAGEIKILVKMEITGDRYSQNIVFPSSGSSARDRSDAD